MRADRRVAGGLSSWGLSCRSESDASSGASLPRQRLGWRAERTVLVPKRRGHGVGKNRLNADIVVSHFLGKRFGQTDDAAFTLLLVIVSIAATLAEVIQLEGIMGAFLAGLAVNAAVRSSPAMWRWKTEPSFPGWLPSTSSRELGAWQWLPVLPG